MKIIYSLGVCLIAALASATACLAKEWRGVVPLRSTRADVERLLGAPKQSTPDAFYYSFTDEIAVVWFQTELCDSDLGRFGIGWNVPVGTVTNIGVIPKVEHKNKALIGNSFKPEDFGAGFSYYTNETEGLEIETFNGIVTSFDYEPMEEEGSFRCPRIVECCVDSFPLIDAYGTLSFEDEKVRLDNFAFVIKEQLARGVVVVYGESRNERKKIIKRAERGKSYLIQKKGIEAQRILIVDGGYRERSSTELNVHPIGGVRSRVYLYPETDPDGENASSKRQ